MENSGQTAAVFGASGKLGRHVLTRRDLAVRALVHRRLIEGLNITCVRGSIADAGAAEEKIRGADIAIQLATAKEDAATFFDVSLRGTFHILESCRQQGDRAVHPVWRRCGAGHLVLFRSRFRWTRIIG